MLTKDFRQRMHNELYICVATLVYLQIFELHSMNMPNGKTKESHKILHDNISFFDTTL